MLPGQNLKCQTPADVYLLLKSSDFISHDLDHAFEDCVDFPPSPSAAPAATASDSNPGVERVAEGLAAVDLGPTTTAATSNEGDASEAHPRNNSRAGTTRRPFEFELVLKKWFDMPKSQEWRCFVRQDRLLGEWRVFLGKGPPVASERCSCPAAPKQRSPAASSCPLFCSSPYPHEWEKCRHFTTRHDSVRIPATRTSPHRDPRLDPTFLGGIDPRPCASPQLYAAPPLPLPYIFPLVFTSLRVH